MYFRNKFNKEFLFLCNHISPKGGSVRLDKQHPLFFNIIQPPFDDKGRYVIVQPRLLYNKLRTTNKEDKIVEDWIALCKNRKSTVINATYDENYITKQNEDYICDINIPTITGDLAGLEDDSDYDYELGDW